MDKDLENKFFIERMRVILMLDRDIQNLQSYYDSALKSDDIEELRYIIKKIKTIGEFAVIRSYVGKFMEQDKTSEKEFEKYCDKYIENCNICIDDFMKDDPEYQEFLKNKLKKAKKEKVINIKDCKKKKK